MSPISVCASELADPIEPIPTFYGYKILGYDISGNVELTGDDYHAYVNQVLADSTNNYPATIDMDVPMAIDIDIPEVKDVTGNSRFIGMKDWKDIVLDMAFNAIANGLVVKDAGNEPTVLGETLQSVGKKRIYYSSAGQYELLRCEINYNPSNKEVNYKITRSFAGALYTYNIHQTELTIMGTGWHSDGYTVYANNVVAEGSRNPVNVNITQGINIYMQSYAVNKLPESITTSTTALADNNSYIIGTYNSNIKYAENTFQTNDYTYNLNHANITGSGQYWNPAVIYLPQYLPISSGTEINQTNINNYTDYGYYWDTQNNTVGLDTSVLMGWLNGELLPQLELIYKNAYQDFPDIDATIGDTDINYFDPFEDEQGSSSDTLPPATLPPGSGGGGGMTPEELDGVLNQESFYILDMETALPPMMLDTLPDVDLPAELTSGAVGISNLVIDLFDSLGILPIFVSLSVLAFVVFTLKGG